MISKDYFYYKRVHSEIEKGFFDYPLRAQAFANAELEGNSKNVEALYIKLRVEALKRIEDQAKIEKETLGLKRKEFGKKTHRAMMRTKVQIILYSGFVTASASIIIFMVFKLFFPLEE
jgi:hypothetical protein